MKQTISLSFEYSKELEAERVISTIKRLDWYRENNYSTEWMTFPAGLDIDDIGNASEEDIVTAIDGEYDEKKFRISEEAARKDFLLYKDRLVTFLNTANLSLIPNISIQLTRYGMGGSYSLPNKVIINVSKHKDVNLVETILHEIMHLHIQHLINEYKIIQWKKERIVDLLMGKLVPEISKLQKMPIDVSDVDVAFSRYYPDVSLIAKTIGSS